MSSPLNNSVLFSGNLAWSWVTPYSWLHTCINTIKAGGKVMREKFPPKPTREGAAQDTGKRRDMQRSTNHKKRLGVSQPLKRNTSNIIFSLGYCGLKYYSCIRMCCCSHATNETEGCNVDQSSATTVQTQLSKQNVII